MIVKLDAAIRFAQTIAIYQVESARPDWFEAVCTACGQSTTGAGRVVEEWGYDHIHECGTLARPRRMLIRHPRLTRNSLSDNGRHTPGEGEARPGNPVADSAYPGAALIPMGDPYKFTKRAVYTIRRALRDSFAADPHQCVEGEGPGEAAGAATPAPPDPSSLTQVRDLLALIAGDGCSKRWGGERCWQDAWLTPDCKWTADRWCDACIAQAALDALTSSPQPDPLRREDVPTRNGSPSVPCGGSKSP